ncbi:hypothetical protein LOTGIDRAFT_183988 [Lottia gigantea]|uniref:C2 domain-containing protein n=1 Tax=Lottia gigantea TaxID=225164 RepID=V3Z0F6_LOTGI|nr:hypothetical protein LOTGIDRAFT_183988 [Lottia gigantea]ESO83943.1 hypothetical protein LOTGIDRAFT_183988 [Lottia gigantea]
MLSVYSDAGEVNYGKIPVTGEMLFGLDFNRESGELRIDIQECKNIAAVDTKNKRSDPYVKAYLLPDKSRNGKRKTKIKKHTLSPVFNEVLKYNISESELYSRSLWLTVWHNDKFGRNDFLGEVLVQFENYKFTDNSPRWYPLQERVSSEDEGPPYKGDLVLSLSYVTPDSLSKNAVVKKKKKKSGPSKGELRVMVKEARNLTALHSNGSSNPFCKGYLLPDTAKVSKQKTNVIKKDCSPAWNQVFLFEDVGLDELPDKSLELTVWDHESLSSNDFLGGNRFNLGTGRCEGKEVDWMDARGEEILTWENIMENPNTWVDVTIALRATMGQNTVKK